MDQTKQSKTPAADIARPERLLSWRDLEERGLISSRTSARRLWSQHPPKFPPPVHLSERVIAWPESVIDAYAASLVYNPQPPRGCAAESQARAAAKRRTLSDRS